MGEKYRTQGSVDETVELDEDGEFRLLGRWFTPRQVENCGFRATRISNPETDPPGTVRVFTPSGDRIIKRADGEWEYLAGSGCSGTAPGFNQLWHESASTHPEAE